MDFNRVRYYPRVSNNANPAKFIPLREARPIFMYQRLRGRLPLLEEACCGCSFKLNFLRSTAGDSRLGIRTVSKLMGVWNITRRQHDTPPLTHQRLRLFNLRGAFKRYLVHGQSTRRVLPQRTGARHLPSAIRSSHHGSGIDL